MAEVKIQLIKAEVLLSLLLLFSIQVCILQWLQLITRYYYMWLYFSFNMNARQCPCDHTNYRTLFCITDVMPQSGEGHYAQSIPCTKVQ